MYAQFCKAIEEANQECTEAESSEYYESGDEDGEGPEDGDVRENEDRRDAEM